MNRTATFLLAGIGNYYLTTLTIWLGHWSSHFPSSPTYGFHVGGHHSLYPDSKTSLSDKFLYGSGRHDSLFALLPTLLMQAGVLAVLTRGWLRLELLLEMAVIAAALSSVHAQFHTGRSVLNRFAWFRRARRIHFSHHDGDVNFMVGDHSWDRIFNTYQAPEINKEKNMSLKATSLKSISCVIFTLLAATLTVAQSYDHTEFLKSPTGTKKGEYVKGTLNFNIGTKQVTFQDKLGSPELTVPFSQIKHLLYERTSKPRYVQAILISPWFILSRSKKHYLTIQYEDAPNSGHYALLHLDKGNYQELLATAEAATGKTVERTEER